MHRIDLAYTLVPGERRGPDLHHPLLELLEGVHRTGSISAAAREMALSYRHVWGALKRWESELGRPLLVWTRGHPAQLSTFGTKLLTECRPTFSPSNSWKAPQGSLVRSVRRSSM